MNERLLKVLKPIRYLFEWSTYVGIIFLVVIFAYTGRILPAPDPYPEGSGAFVLTFGIKSLILIAFLVGCGINGLLFILSRFQRLFKYPVEITPQNIELQYHLAKIMFSVMQIIVSIIACFLMVNIYKSTFKLTDPVFIILCIQSLAIITATFFIYVFLAQKFK